MLMKVKIYKKMRQYELALKDASFAYALMNEKQLLKHADLKFSIKELRVSI